MPGLSWPNILDKVEDSTPRINENKVKALLDLLNLYFGFNLQGRAVLDIGCRTGKYVLELAKKGANVVGVEQEFDFLESIVAKQVRERISAKLICDATGDNLNKLSKMDAIICMDDSFSRYALNKFKGEMLLTKWLEILKLDGIIVIEIPKEFTVGRVIDSGEDEFKISFEEEQVSHTDSIFKKTISIDFRTDEAMFNSKRIEKYRKWSVDEVTEILKLLGVNQLQVINSRSSCFVVAKNN